MNNKLGREGRVLICPDSFKGSLSSFDAAMAIGSGVSEVMPSAEVCMLPIADGGEGTLDALVTEENRIKLTVRGPLGEELCTEYGFVVGEDGKKTAIIEMARAAGLVLVPEDKRDPKVTSTVGVGEMISDALDRGFDGIVLTLGGSATNDLGCGMMTALGVRFLRSDGVAFLPVGGNLTDIASIDTSGLDKRLPGIGITVACDVDNPLTGERGAAVVYAPQKGATEEDVALLESGAVHLEGMYSRLCGAELFSVKGLGAAGGLSLPLVALCGASLISGIDAVLDASGFDSLLEGCRFVLTGEGRTDMQSLSGKAISGVARRAHARGIPTFVLCGSADDSICRMEDELSEMGIKGIYPISDGSMTLEYSMKNAKTLLKKAAVRLAMQLGEEGK